MSPWSDNLLCDGSGGYEKVAADDAVGFTICSFESCYGETSKTGSIYGSETLLWRGRAYHPEREWVEAPRPPPWTINYGTTRWLGVGQPDSLLDLDRDCAGYAGQFIWTGTDHRWATLRYNQNDTPRKVLFRYCRYRRPSKEWFLPLPKSSGIGWWNIRWSISPLELGQSRIQPIVPLMHTRFLFVPSPMPAWKLIVNGNR